jgi:hypothetical protein
MTIARSTVLAKLVSLFSSFATAAGQALATDSSTGYGPDIDDALRELGYEESELATAAVDEADRKDYFVLVEYFAAHRLRIQISSIPDIRLGPQSESYGKVIDAITAIENDAKNFAAALGYSLDGETTWTTAQWSSDTIEPRSTWDVSDSAQF